MGYHVTSLYKACGVTAVNIRAILTLDTATICWGVPRALGSRSLDSSASRPCFPQEAQIVRQVIEAEHREANHHHGGAWHEKDVQVSTVNSMHPKPETRKLRFEKPESDPAEAPANDQQGAEERVPCPVVQGRLRGVHGRRGQDRLAGCRLTHFETDKPKPSSSQQAPHRRSRRLWIQGRPSRQLPEGPFQRDQPGRLNLPRVSVSRSSVVSAFGRLLGRCGFRRDLGCFPAGHSFHSGCRHPRTSDPGALTNPKTCQPRLSRKAAGLNMRRIGAGARKQPAP